MDYLDICVYGFVLLCEAKLLYLSCMPHEHCLSWSALVGRSFKADVNPVACPRFVNTMKTSAAQ